MTPHAPDTHAGYTLAEATIALVLGAGLTLCLATILTVVGRLAATQTRLTAAADTERIVAAVLGAELRSLTAADVAFGADSVRLRAFRGAGVVCSADETGLLVSYRGVRLPEPDKDSVLLIWPDFERAADVEAVGAASGCERDDAPSLRLAIRGSGPDSVPAPAYALVFETGAYSISAAALRYRRGAGGRQPLTETNLSTAFSTLTRASAGGAAVTAVASLRPAAGGEDASTWTVHMPQGGLRPVGRER